MHLVCSSPLSGSALGAVQNAGGNINAFGYPASASFATANIQSLCNTWGLPLGNGNNAMGLSYNGQLIDAVRASCAAWREVSSGAADGLLRRANRLASRARRACSGSA
jgi:hypothetical protein